MNMYTYLESLTVRRMFGCLGAARKCLQRDPEVASNRMEEAGLQGAESTPINREVFFNECPYAQYH